MSGVLVSEKPGGRHKFVLSRRCNFMVSLKVARTVYRTTASICLQLCLCKAFLFAFMMPGWQTQSEEANSLVPALGAAYRLVVG